MKKLYKNIFIVLLVINFCVLAYALMWAEHDNVLYERRFLLVISFITIAGFARQCCKKNKEASVNNDSSL